MVQAADFAKTLQLTVLSPSTQTEWDIRTTGYAVLRLL